MTVKMLIIYIDRWVRKEICEEMTKGPSRNSQIYNHKTQTKNFKETTLRTDKGFVGAPSNQREHTEKWKSRVILFTVFRFRVKTALLQRRDCEKDYRHLLVDLKDKLVLGR